MYQNALVIMTAVYSGLNHNNQKELAAPIEFLYRRYSKLKDFHEQDDIFNDFLEYCNDYEIIIYNYWHPSETKKAA